MKIPFKSILTEDDFELLGEIDVEVEVEEMDNNLTNSVLLPFEMSDGISNMEQQIKEADRILESILSNSEIDYK